MTIAIKPTASGSTIEQNGSTILTVDGSGNITPSNDLYPKVPAFKASNTTDQAVSNAVWTKIAFQSEEFDTHNFFDSTTNYRFQPTITGYYHFNCLLRIEGSVSDSYIALYKNGSLNEYVVSGKQGTAIGTNFLKGSCLVYLNGSTDYVEFYGNLAGTSLNFGYFDTTSKCVLAGHLVSV